MKVFVVIAVHNRLELTRRCLSCLAAQTHEARSCIVVDDGSTDGTAEAVGREWPDVALLHGNGRLWWAGATAKGIHAALREAVEGDFVLLLNNDTEFASDYLQELVEASQANGRALVGSLNVDIRDPARVVDAGVRWDWAGAASFPVVRDPEAAWSTGVNTLSGRGMLVPVEVFRRVGNLESQRLPHYAADEEFAMRAARAGFRLVVSHRAVLRVHAELTGSEGDLKTPISPQAVRHLLFSRRSIRQIKARLTLVRLACPRAHRLVNYMVVIAASIWLATNVAPFFQCKQWVFGALAPPRLRDWMVRRGLLVAPTIARRAEAPSPGSRREARPTVSVVIPTCNRAGILRRCLAAVARQSYRPLEVIVVDDASTDETTAMLEDFARSHASPDIRRLRFDGHRGANAARNWGVGESRGAIVAFLDSDCIAESDWLERLIAGFGHGGVAAVTGVCTDPTPANIYELAFSGSNRVHGEGAAPRLVGGNMAVRKEVLMRFGWDEDRRHQVMRADGTPDTSAGGGCDEEGLFLLISAAGYEQRVAPDAVVLHDHRYDRRSFFLQAFLGGGSAAHLVYKYWLPPRLDLLPWTMFYVSLALTMGHVNFAYAAGACLAASLGAILYNEIRRKKKSLIDAVRCLPVLVAYYQVRLAGYLYEAWRVRVGYRVIERVRLRRRRRT